MNLLDENFPEDQRPLLRKWRVPHRQIGRELAAFGVKDNDINSEGTQFWVQGGQKSIDQGWTD